MSHSPRPPAGWPRSWPCAPACCAWPRRAPAPSPPVPRRERTTAAARSATATASTSHASTSATPSPPTTSAPAANPNGLYGLDAMTDLAQLPDLRLQQRMGHLSSIAPDLSNDDWDKLPVHRERRRAGDPGQQGPGRDLPAPSTLASRASASTTRVRVYLDGATTPQVDGTMASLAAGTTAPFLSRWWRTSPPAATPTTSRCRTPSARKWP